MPFKANRIYYLLLTSFFFLNSCSLLDNGDKKDSGEIIWSVENQYSSSVTTQPLIDEDKVYVFHDGFIRAYNLKNGKLIWSQQILFGGSTLIYSYNILADDNRVYLDTGFNVHSFNKNNGQVNWMTHYTNDGTDFTQLSGAQISQDQDFLYLPRKKIVLKVKKSNGQIEADFELDALVPNGINQGAVNPTLSKFGDDILYIPTKYWDTSDSITLWRGNLFAFDKNTHQIIWQFKGPDKVKPTDEFEATDSLIVSSPMNEIRVNEDYVVVASNPTIMLLDRLTGDLVWHIPLKDKYFEGFPGYENAFSGVYVGLAIDETGIYITSADGFLRKLNWTDGSEIWNVNIKYTNTTLLTVHKDKLYFTNSGGGGIWVVDTMTGEVLFNSNPPGYSNDSHDVYLSSLGVGNGYMVNVGSKKVYTLKSFE